MLSPKNYSIKMNVQLQPPNSASRPNFFHEKRVAMDIIIRVAKFQKTNQVKDLHPTARCTGNIISIPRVPWSTFCTIQRLIEGPELELIRHWKVCFDLAQPLTNQNFQYCNGTLSWKMPSSTHELLAQFSAELQTEMWNGGSQKSFYPPEVRHQKYFISDSRSTDIWLQQDGCLISKKVPDGGLTFPHEEYPFLVLEVAHSESDRHALKKAKDYIKYSQTKIIYVIIVSVHTKRHNNLVSTEVNSEKLSATKAGQSTPSPSTLSSLKCSTPTTPSELGMKYGVNPAFNIERKANLASTTSSPRLGNSTTSNLAKQSLSQGSKASTYGIQDSLKVWVFKQAFQDDPDNLSGPKLIDAQPIIECAEVFPKRPGQQDSSFDILWTELSDKPNEKPDTKFTVHLDLLHRLAKTVLLEREQRYGKVGMYCRAAPDAKTTDDLSPTSSQDSSNASSESSHSTDPSYGV